MRDTINITLPTFQKGLHLLFAGGMGLLALLLLWLIPNQTDFLVFFPVVIIGIPIGIWIVKDEERHFYAVIAGFVFIAKNEGGIQVTELAYSIVWFSYLIRWYVVAKFILRKKLIQTTEDKLIFVLIATFLLAAVNGLLHGADLTYFRGEMVAFLFMFLYFPLKEKVVNNPKTASRVYHILTFMLLLFCYASIKDYLGDIAGADAAWKLLRARSVDNIYMIMVCTTLACIGLLFARTLKMWVTYLVLAGAGLLAVLLTQSRSAWVAILLAIFVAFLLVNADKKKEILGYGFAIILVIIAGILVVLGDNAIAVLDGFIERFSTLRNATTQDISLVNRFYEVDAVWEIIKTSPIIGNGIGVKYHYYSLISEHTRVWAFVHNGYYSVLLKHGFWGFGLLLFIWLKTIVNGLWLFRNKSIIPLERMWGLAIVCVLIASFLTSWTHGLMYLNEHVYLFMIYFAISAGLKQKYAQKLQ